MHPKPSKPLSAPDIKARIAAYVAFCNGDFAPEFDPFTETTIPRRKRRRRTSLARTIKTARKAGSDVKLAPDGTMTVIASVSEPDTTPITVGVRYLDDNDEWN